MAGTLSPHCQNEFNFSHSGSLPELAHTVAAAPPPFFFFFVSSFIFSHLLLLGVIVIGLAFPAWKCGFKSGGLQLGEKKIKVGKVGLSKVISMHSWIWLTGCWKSDSTMGWPISSNPTGRSHISSITGLHQIPLSTNDTDDSYKCLFDA